MNKFTKVRNYSALEVANLCGVVNQTAINWIKKNYLKAYTTPGGQYRIYGEELVAFMNSREMKIPPELKGYLHSDSKNILFIEDDDQFAWQFLDEIKSEYPNCTVDRAYDSFEAGRKLAREERDLILINSDMIGLDAKRVCEVIREDSVGVLNTIIVFTQSVDTARKKSLLKAGADVYIRKPFDIGQISIYLE